MCVVLFRWVISEAKKNSLAEAVVKYDGNCLLHTYIQLESIKLISSK